MMKKNKILAVSFIAMLAVSSAHATIVTQENIVGANGVSVTVPTTGTNKGKVQVSGPDLSGKENVLTFTTSGSGNVVTGVSKSGSTVTVNKGTTLGSLATKSAVASGDITDGTIVNADISSSAAITTNKMGAITGYAKATTNEALATTDTLNTALGKLEKKADDAATAAANAKNNVTASGSNGVTASASNGAITVTGVDADASNKGVMKLYTGTGTNTDGTMTQNAINTALNGKQADLTVMSVSEGTTGTATTERSMDAAKLKQIVQGTNASSNPVNGLAANAYLTGYAKGTSSAAVATTDTIKTAIGKLENQIAGKQAALTIDTAMSSSSTNPVQNKVVNTALSGKADKATTLAGYGITDAYTKTETGTQITNAVNALDSTSTGTGNVVIGVSQTNGKVAVTKGSIAESDVTNLTTDLAAKQTTANMVTSTSQYNDDIADANKYPNMPVVNQMISDNTVGLTSRVTALENDKQDKSTAVTHTAGNAAGDASTPVYVTAAGVATAITKGTIANNDTAGQGAGLVTGKTVYTEVRPTATNNTTSKGYLASAAAATNLTNLDTAIKTIHPNTGEVKIPSGSETSSTLASIWVE